MLGEPENEHCCIIYVFLTWKVGFCIFCHVIFSSNLFLSKYIYFPCSCWQSRRKVGETETDREREKDVFFFSPLFITIANQELHASLLCSVAGLPALSFLSNTIRLNSHSLYLFSLYFYSLIHLTPFFLLLSGWRSPVSHTGSSFWIYV